MEKTNIKIRRLVFAAMFAAITCLFTAYIKVPTGINQGYVHFGDSVIYLAASILPFPYAMCSAAVGGALADVLAGVPVWSLPTAIIKACNVIPFAIYFSLKHAKRKELIFSAPTFIASIISGFITFGGYFLANTLMFGFPAACLELPFSFVQPLGSMIIFCIAGFALDKASFKSKLKI